MLVKQQFVNILTTTVIKSCREYSTYHKPFESAKDGFSSTITIRPDTADISVVCIKLEGDRFATLVNMLSQHFNLLYIY